MLVRVLLLLAFAGVGAGCATKPEYANVKTAEAATLRAEKPDKSDVLFGKIVLGIDAIDGQSNGAIKHPEIVYVQPGRRELEIYVGGIYFFNKHASAYIELDFQAAHSYRLVPARKDDNFTVEQIDETDPAKPVSVKTVKVPAIARIFLPIPIE